MNLSIEINEACPCGSAKSYLECCKFGVCSSSDYLKYEFSRELLQMALGQAIKVLDTAEYSSFRESSISQFLLFLDIPEDVHEGTFDNPFYSDMLVEWLLFFAPFPVQMEVLSQDSEMPEFVSFMRNMINNEDYTSSIKQYLHAMSKYELEATMLSTSAQSAVVGLVESYISVFEIQCKHAGLYCLRDCISGQLHFTFDDILDLDELQSSILVGRMIRFCDHKVFNLLNAVSRSDLIMNGLAEQSGFWSKEVALENESVSIDIQLNLISALRPLIIG